MVWPGMFVKADIITRSREDTLVLPRHAVVIRNSGGRVEQISTGDRRVSASCRRS